MEDDLKDQGTLEDTTATGAPADSEHEYSEVELEAMERGWKPKDQYEGDPGKWRSAELFLELEPFYKRIETQSKQLKNYQKAVTQIAKDMQTVKEQAYKKAIADIRAERKNAMQEGDYDRVDLLDEKLDLVKEEHQRLQAQVPAEIEDEAVDPNVFVEWTKRNTWYERDAGLKDWADARGVVLYQQGKDKLEILQQLEREAKQKFPEKFTNPNRERPGAVSAAGKKPATAKAVEQTMSAEERRIMETILRVTPGLTKEDYLKNYAGAN